VGRTKLNGISISTPTEKHNKGIEGRYIPLRIVDLALRAEELLLTGLVGIVTADLVAVFFGLEERENMETAPDLFAGKFTKFRHLH
jgi:hypothetical protein